MTACSSFSYVVPRGRVGERPPHLIRLPASGIRLPEDRNALLLKVSGAGLTDLEAQAPEPFLPVARAESPLAGTGPQSLF